MLGCSKSRCVTRDSGWGTAWPGLVFCPSIHCCAVLRAHSIPFTASLELAWQARSRLPTWQVADNGTRPPRHRSAAFLFPPTVAASLQGQQGSPVCLSRLVVAGPSVPFERPPYSTACRIHHHGSRLRSSHACTFAFSRVLPLFHVLLIRRGPDLTGPRCCLLDLGPLLPSSDDRRLLICLTLTSPSTARAGSSRRWHLTVATYQSGRLAVAAHIGSNVRHCSQIRPHHQRLLLVGRSPSYLPGTPRVTYPPIETATDCLRMHNRPTSSLRT